MREERAGQGHPVGLHMAETRPQVPVHHSLTVPMPQHPQHQPGTPRSDGGDIHSTFLPGGPLRECLQSRAGEPVALTAWATLLRSWAERLAPAPRDSPIREARKGWRVVPPSRTSENKVGGAFGEATLQGGLCRAVKNRRKGGSGVESRPTWSQTPPHSDLSAPHP